MSPRAKAFSYFKKVDPVLAGAIDPRLLPESLAREVNAPLLFEELCWTIIGQQLSGKAANTIFERFKKLCRRVTPRAVLTKTETDLRAIGVSGAKARAIHDLAARVLDGRLALNRIFSLSDEEVMRALVAVKGIGPWTAEMIMMFSLGREDIFSFGDLGLIKGFQRVYGMKRRPSERTMRRVSAQWAPYRTWAARILWKVLDTP